MTSSTEDPVARTIASYNRGAAMFAERSADRTHMSRLHDQFLAQCPGGLVLDLGSGPGHDAAVLATRGLRIVASDASLALLHQARRHDAIRGHLVGADLRNLPFPDAKFDGIWACASLLHLPKTKAPVAIREANRVLRAGGIFFTSLQEGTGHAMVSVSASDPLPGRTYSYYRAEEWLALIEAEGFHVIEQRLQRTTDHVSPGATGWIETFARASGASVSASS